MIISKEQLLTLILCWNYLESKLVLTGILLTLEHLITTHAHSDISGDSFEPPFGSFSSSFSFLLVFLVRADTRKSSISMVVVVGHGSVLGFLSQVDESFVLKLNKKGR